MNIDSLTIRTKLTVTHRRMFRLKASPRWRAGARLDGARPPWRRQRRSACQQSFFLPLWNELGEHENWAELQRSIMYEELGGSCRILLRWHQTVRPSGNEAGHLKHTICGNVLTWKHSTGKGPCPGRCATQSGFPSWSHRRFSGAAGD